MTAEVSAWIWGCVQLESWVQACVPLSSRLLLLSTAFWVSHCVRLVCSVSMLCGCVQHFKSLLPTVGRRVSENSWDPLQTVLLRTLFWLASVHMSVGKYLGTHMLICRYVSYSSKFYSFIHSFIFVTWGRGERERITHLLSTNYSSEAVKAGLGQSQGMWTQSALCGWQEPSYASRHCCFSRSPCQGLHQSGARAWKWV